MTILDNSLQAWGIALLIMTAAILLLALMRKFLERKFAAFAKRTKNELDDIAVQTFQQTKVFFILTVAIYFASLYLTLPTTIETAIQIAAKITLFIQFGYWGTAVITFIIARQFKYEMETKDASGATSVNALGLILKGALWVIVILLAVDNIPGIDINSLIASLGIGGIAVALAAQNVLGDVFASIAIAFDKPFVLGDYIDIGGLGGTVEHIGLKSSHLRALSGEQIVISNTDLLSSRIRNLGRLEQRRVDLILGIAYDTPHDKLIKIPKIIEGAIIPRDNVAFLRAHLTKFADSSINYEVIYTIDTPDFTFYLDTQQAVNLEILNRFQLEGIALAFPTQTIHIQNPSN